jgi:uncharacterized protein
LFILFLATSSSYQKFTPIFDYEEILSNKEERKLRKLYSKHEVKTTNQFALVTSADIDGYEDIQQYATDFGNKHGVGVAEKDNGIVIAYSNNQRKVAIATGLQMEKILTDSIAESIIYTQMIPHFKKGETYDGLMAGSKAIIHFLEKQRVEKPFNGTLKF